MCQDNTRQTNVMESLSAFLFTGVRLTNKRF
jgi:hypothetical protein